VERKITPVSNTSNITSYHLALHTFAMTATRPRNLIILSVAASVLLLLFSAPLLSYAQEAAAVTADDLTAIIEDVTDLGDVNGDGMADLTEMLEDEVVVAITDEADEENLDTASVESCGSEEETLVTTLADETSGTTTAQTAAESQTDVQSTTTEEEQRQSAATTSPPPAQSGPFIDLFGEVLLSLEMVDETHAQVHQHYTNEILSGKKVVGLYFSADW
jgi:hypothetical protein